MGGGEMLGLIFDFLFDFFFLLPLLLKRKWEIPHGRKKLRMGKSDFDIYQEGRRYTKKAGDYLPDPHSAI